MYSIIFGRVLGDSEFLGNVRQGQNVRCNRQMAGRRVRPYLIVPWEITLSIGAGGSPNGPNSHLVVAFGDVAEEGFVGDKIDGRA